MGTTNYGYPAIGSDFNTWERARESYEQTAPGAADWQLNHQANPWDAVSGSGYQIGNTPRYEGDIDPRTAYSQAWMQNLSPDQRADYNRVVSEHNAQEKSTWNKNVAMALAFAGAGAFAGLGGLGALGEGGSAIGAGAANGSWDILPAAVGGGSSVAGGGAAASGGPWSSFLGSLATSAGKSVGGSLLSQLIAGAGNAYEGNKQAGQYNDVINTINNLYSPDSAYSKQMQQALARKDAAAGRNSQYGTRAVELAAALTKAKSDALTSPGYGNLLGQRVTGQNIPINGLLAMLGSGAGQDLITKAGGATGDWLSKLFGNQGNAISPTSSGGDSLDNWIANFYANGG